MMKAPEFVETDLEVVAPPFSEDALALQFAKDHCEHLRYVAMWSRWLRYDGKLWQFDDTLNVFDLARAICRETAATCNKTTTATALSSAKTVAAVERLARCDRRIAATVEQWDADPWLLNTPGGVVDLRSGKIGPHRAENYLSKITGVAPDFNCPTDLWLQFLRVVTAEDNDLIAYLQRLCGYSLTGVTNEHILAFLWGTGANGKSTFIDAITRCLGDYHRTAPIETFTASYSDRHPTDLAGLRGARLVTAVETEEGRRWAESKIKTLTGGDKISARFMRQDFFEYTPQFKLVIAGNHKPGLRSVDEAIRRRFNLIPFAVTIPVGERDKQFGEKLKAEAPGILAWMIEGCLDWQQRGLDPPEAVTVATSAYLEAQDAIAAWIDEECEQYPNAWEGSQKLFAGWRDWATRFGEYPGDMRTFRDRLEARGIFYKRQGHGGQRGYQGIRLKPSDDTDFANAFWNR
jgi:putative DNA primase/helicase